MFSSFACTVYIILTGIFTHMETLIVDPESTSMVFKQIVIFPL